MMSKTWSVSATGMNTLSVFDNAMYTNVKYNGLTLPQWAEVLHNTYSLGELYQMAMDGVNFNKLAPSTAIVNSLQP